MQSTITDDGDFNTTSLYLEWLKWNSKGKKLLFTCAVSRRVFFMFPKYLLMATLSLPVLVFVGCTSNSNQHQTENQTISVTD